MYEYPTPEQIEGIVRRAHFERSRAMKSGMLWIGRQVAAPFRSAIFRPTERRS
jgi:hypothetical protein